jgi:M6 family metalloprotease-like protein
VRGLRAFLGLVACGIAVFGISRAATLEVRPVETAKAKLRPGATAPARPGVQTLEPKTAQAYTRLAARRRSFDDVLSRPGVDWTTPMRRKGWVHPARRAPMRYADGSLGTPPDTLHVAFIRIDFLADRGGPASTGDGRFDLSGPDTTAPPVDRPPHNRRFFQAHGEALRRYYDVQSYGRAVVNVEVWPRNDNGAYSLTDMADFGPWEFSQDIYGRAVHMFRKMLFAADSQSIVMNDRIPWDDIDRIVLIHAGSDLQSDIRQDSPEDIPSFTIGVSDTDLVEFPDSTFRPIDRAAIIPERVDQDGYFGTINGVLAHECGHLLFNLADLYDIQTGRPIVGLWSLMDSGNNVGSIVVLPDSTEIFATGLLPPSIDPFQRSFVGDALTFPEASYGDTVDLVNSQRFPDMRKVTLSSDEFLILENRWLAPDTLVDLDQDDSTRVVLGPKSPDRFEYDALIPGGGLLVWHIDTSVLPLESYFPLDTTLRANPDLGWNTNPARPGISIIEADALDDLGDPGSPFILGAPFDPYFVGNYTVLGDTTVPNLRPFIGTRPHRRIDVLTKADSVMRIAAFRTFELESFPVHATFPPEGAALLAVDADGDNLLETCWAGGDTLSPDSTALFAVRVNGQGLTGSSPVFARLDARPRPEMAAATTGAAAGQGPALFAVTTFATGPDTSSRGGRVWLVDQTGATLPGWPPALPSIVTTPPVMTGTYPNISVFVGAANGRIYRVFLNGSIDEVQALGDSVTGRLAVRTGSLNGTLVAAGSLRGDVVVVNFTDFSPDRGNSTNRAANVMPGWPLRIGAAPFAPDFLWIDFNGAPGSPPAPDMACGGGLPGGSASLVVHEGSRLWAYCESGQLLPGWGRDFGDRLAPGLGAGDPDGDGYPEVLIQTAHSGVAFVNVSGYPSPGWPRRGTREDFETRSVPLALDVDGDGGSEIVAMNASGIISAFRSDGRKIDDWPLASGVGTTGSPVVADLDRDGDLEMIAPDRFGTLYGYALGIPTGGPVTNSWLTLGGDIGRTSNLPATRTSTAPATFSGPLIAGSLKAYPNPAVRGPLHFAFQLTEPAEVEVRVLDVSGHEVASFTRAASPSDNVVTWDPGAAPAGLYVARLKFRGSGTERVETMQIGVVR